LIGVLDPLAVGLYGIDLSVDGRDPPGLDGFMNGDVRDPSASGILSQ